MPKCKPQSVTRKRGLLALVKGSDGWYLNAAAISPDVPLWGPWTRTEALEARRSYLRNSIEQFRPWQVNTTLRRSRRRA